MNCSSPLMDLTLAALVLGVSVIVAARTTQPHTRVAVAAATLHPIASLVLFYSLALHMHRTLGGWPQTIGQAGFPPGLKSHADLAQQTLGSLILACMFAWPIAALLCMNNSKLRPGLRYLGIYALTSGLSLLAMRFAPEQFLVWWWD